MPPSTQLHPKLQNTCIFCALRWQITPIRVLPKRRSFQSSRILRRPPATAAAQTEEEHVLTPNSESLQHGRRWAASEPIVNKPPLQSGFRIRRTRTEPNLILPTPRAPIPRNPTRDRILDTHISHSRVSQSETRLEPPPRKQNCWVCQLCGHGNGFALAKCEVCNDSRTYAKFPSSRVRVESGNPDDVAQDWKHVRRTGLPVKTKTPPTPNFPAKFSGAKLGYIEADQVRMEQSRQERLERTKNGGFVNLRSDHQRLDRTLPSDPMRSTVPEPASEASNSKQPDDQYSIKNVDEISKSWTSPVTKPDEPFDSSPVLAGGWKKWTPAPLERSPKVSENLSASSVSTAKSNKSDETKTPKKYEEWCSISSETPHFINGESVVQPKIATQHAPDLQSWKPEGSKALEVPVASYGVAKNDFKASVISAPSVPGPTNWKNVRSMRDLFDEGDPFAPKNQEKRGQKKRKVRQKPTASPKPIHLPEYISVSNLAAALKVNVEDFGSRMRALGFEETNSDHILDAETAGLIATEFNFDPIVDKSENQDLAARPPAKEKSLLPVRPPVITIMGHVDHGKTTLLDWLRKSSVAASEHGGITQHIGAFSVSMPGGRLMTFLDTPGHAAFLSMRQRGANVTDIVILVVAADDSVKPQTIEAIKHSQAAKVPIIIAINKVDKDDSDIERVKQDLARYGVEIEDYGGDTQVVLVSGKTGQGMQELEDAVSALADILDIRAEVDGDVEGWVLEATKKKTGLVATVLVRRGTIRPGVIIVAGNSWAKVRSLRNEAGFQVEKAGPGTPVEIDGWREQPIAGDEVLQANDERQAKSVVEHRIQVSERNQLATDMAAMNESRRLEQEKREQLTSEEAEVDEPTLKVPEPQPGMKEVFFIIKADVSGSVEAVLESVSSLGNSEVRPNILRSGIGPVVQFDLDHAASAKGHIISFNNPIEPHIARMAQTAGVEILNENIIYKLIDEVKAKLSEQLAPTITQKVLGEAEVAQVFDINTKGRVMVRIAGCKVRNGILAKTKKVRVVRDSEVIYNGSLSSLRNVKKDVVEMRKGSECGLGLDGWTAFEIGDLVQSYEEIVEKRSL